jgi:hypothetical protein
MSLRGDADRPAMPSGPAAARVSPSERRRVEAFLADHGAAGLAHPGGTLLAHLRRTADMLDRWGARPALVLAGLCHAAYGTQGFAPTLLGLDQRGELVDLIGNHAEALVYAYASCDRDHLYARLAAGRRPGELRDRFRGTDGEAPPDLVADLVELTFANELDVVRHGEAGDDGAAPLGRLFASCRPLVTESAYADAVDLLGPWMRA